MFDNLSSKITSAMRTLKGKGRITDVNVAATVKEIRRALMDADVNYKVAKEITERDGYHFLVVDDIDYLSSDCINLLSAINVRKIATCLNDNLKKISDDDSDFYNIEDKVGLNIKNE